MLVASWREGSGVWHLFSVEERGFPEHHLYTTAAADALVNSDFTEGHTAVFGFELLERCLLAGDLSHEDIFQLLRRSVRQRRFDSNHKHLRIRMRTNAPGGRGYWRQL